MNACHRVQFLKSSSDLIKEKKTFSELTTIYQSLSLQSSNYEVSSKELLKSALSVSPDKGVYSAISISQRSAWIDKAISLRCFTLKAKTELDKSIKKISPEYFHRQNKIKILEEKKTEALFKIEKAKILNAIYKESSENEDLSELELIRRKNQINLRGGSSV